MALRATAVLALAAVFLVAGAPVGSAKSGDDYGAKVARKQEKLSKKLNSKIERGTLRPGEKEKIMKKYNELEDKEMARRRKHS